MSLFRARRSRFATRDPARVSSATRVEVVTEGILLRRLQGDPSLEGVGAVILDEFHERNLDADLALALCLDAQRWTRPDLRLLVMSATLGGGLAEGVQELMTSCQEEGAAAAPDSGDRRQTVPVVVSEGRSFPVTTVYLGAPVRRDGGRLARAVADAILGALDHDAGDVLAFLPGVAEIRQAQQLLREEAPRGVRVLPLHGNLAPEQQDEAIRPSPSGARRVVLATPIAESSITIDGVRVVVDSGLRRAPVFDEGSGFSRLRTERVSVASADQRRGRAGRTGPGVCYRLWDPSDDLDESTAPEIADADLAPLALELAAWGDPAGDSLPWLEAPDPGRMEVARQLLRDLGAVDEKGAVTEGGRRMAALGLHPRFAHLVLRSRDLGCEELGCIVASLLSERDILRGSGTGGGGGGPQSADIALRLSALAGDGPIIVDRAGAQRVLQGARQLLRQLRAAAASTAAAADSDSDPAGGDADGDGGGEGEDEGEDEGEWSASEEQARPQPAGADPKDPIATGAGGVGIGARAFSEAWQDQALRRGLVGALVALAYPDRIAQRRDAGSSGGRATFVLSSGRPVRLLDPGDPLKDAQYIAVAELSGGRDGRNDAARLGAALTLSAIKTHLASEIREEVAVFWAPASKVVLARRQSRLGSLVLSEAPAEVGDDRALPVLFKALQDGGWASLPIPPAVEAWRHRAAWLRAAEVAALGASALPDLSEGALLGSLHAWLAPYAAGVRGRAALSKLDWGAVIRGLMTWEQQQRVEADAPSHVTLPTGSRVPIEYGSRSQPTARARLQECFGLVDTPRLGGLARVPLLLELLSPAQRPLQVTADLASFWATSYSDVRKDMAGRYPKHVWPVDPLNAEATRLTKKAQAMQQAQQPAGGGGASSGSNSSSGGGGQGKKKRR
ncbi:ATP-dependent helicase HrpB [Monoraphidium neglectum]|uniref:ATP-dependent helicase HrpB n=1 Tax=Monoraphidium neglectum TaxID=145388 RepID=A0A0D2KRQ6_9CHLO|nr:ATP-dependent helicase HrpB [Monoraphidium neglectum]KIY98238.1 ATP-dependent helicase HrpB [Monoraphidium neglectum]|eukprot:XP_013897258.1 ATP-dependent helicase HrpB [Monoraphidium neglectum]